METADQIWLASKAAEKGWSYETLKYGDDLYSFRDNEKEELMDSIWGYVTEYKEIGSIAFSEKYKGYSLY
jgi:hypothetical protein